MATTTNYSWTTPDDTALVKDGAAAIRSLGTAIDSTVFTNAGNAISKTIVDAKGDLIVATAADTVARLASSASNGDLLTVDTSTASGLKWSAPATSGTSWSIVNSGGTSLSGTTTTISGISGADKLMIVLRGATSGTAGQDVYLRFNGDTGSNYNSFGFQAEYGSTYAASNFVSRNEFTDSRVSIATFSNNTASTMNGTLLLTGANTTNDMMYQSFFGAGANGGNSHYHKSLGGWYDASATISSISFTLQSGSFTAGTVYVYKSA
jgi:hypothetical protein